MPSWFPTSAQVRATFARFGVWLLGLVSFAAPFAVSLAANVTAGLHSGSSVLLVAGVAIPVLLMLAIELWRRLPPVEGRWARFFRGLAMAAPVAVAAGWSWMDTTGLLLAQFPREGPGSPSAIQWVLCFSAPLAVDGLAVLAVLARDVGPAKLSPPIPSSAPSTGRDDAQGWGGPETVAPPVATRPATPAPATPSPAALTPVASRRVAPATSPSSSKSPSVVHVAGWQPGMEVVAREQGQPTAMWLCARARLLEVRVTRPNGNRRSNPDLRHDVETAELERARSEAVSA